MYTIQKTEMGGEGTKGPNVGAKARGDSRKNYILGGFVEEEGRFSSRKKKNERGVKISSKKGILRTKKWGGGTKESSSSKTRRKGENLREKIPQRKKGDVETKEKDQIVRAVHPFGFGKENTRRAKEDLHDPNPYKTEEHT